MCRKRVSKEFHSMRRNLSDPQNVLKDKTICIIYLHDGWNLLGIGLTTQETGQKHTTHIY